MSEEQFPHSIKKIEGQPFSYYNQIIVPFEDTAKILNSSNDTIISNHYTFTKDEIIAILNYIDKNPTFKVNAITIIPVIENKELKLYVAATQWKGEEKVGPEFPGGAYPDGPPVLKTKLEATTEVASEER